ncbi:hypothetical protein LP420_10045 [Massilia sp. B-10]|nr:hypothetical protein LP420_10045 [Massilia sp. B-10]UUZ55735.1 hypothetical protein LP419_09455 [Massilia sp. H-1]
MKRYFAAAMLSCMALSALAAGPIAAKVNNVVITGQEVDEYIQASAESRGFRIKPGEATVQLIGLELLAQEAIRGGKDRSA